MTAPTPPSLDLPTLTDVLVPGQTAGLGAMDGGGVDPRAADGWALEQRLTELLMKRLAPAIEAKLREEIQAAVRQALAQGRAGD